MNDRKLFVLLTKAAIAFVFAFGFALKGYAQASSPYLYEPIPSTSSAPSSAENGYVEQVNGHLHLEFPLGNALPGRGGKNAAHRLVYDSNLWNPGVLFGYPSPYSMNPASFGGWSTLPVQSSIAAYGNNEILYLDTQGVQHAFPTSVGGSNVFASDSSGYYMLANVRFNGDTGVEVYSPDGSMEYSDLPVNGATKQYQQQVNTIDPNGNYQGECPARGQAYYTVTQHCDSLGRVDFYEYYDSPTSPGSSGPLDYNYYYQYPNAQGGMSTVEVDYVQINVASNFQIPGWRDCTGQYCLMWVAKRILQPDGSSYSFLYDCDSQNSYHGEVCSSPDGKFYGEITQMTLPTGGIINYQYQMFHDVYGAPSRWVQQKVSAATGTTSYSPAVVSSCSAGQVGCRQSLTVTQANGVSTTTTFVVDKGSWPVQISSSDTTTTLSYDMTNPCVEVQCVGHDYIRKTKEVTRQSGTDGNVVTEMQYSYDSKESGLISQVKEWRYASAAGDPDASYPPTVISTTQWYSPASAPGAAAATTSAGGTNIHRPSSVTVCSGAGQDPLCLGGGTLLSRSVYGYDESVPATFAGAANHLDNAYGANLRTRGNPTTVSRWIQGNQYASSQIAYDTAGQVISTTDALGNTSTYDYTDSLVDDAGANGTTPHSTVAPTHAYATTITSPIVSISTKQSYYFGTGALATKTDPNNQQSSWHYDQLGRVTGTNWPLGWQLFTYPSTTEMDSYTAISDKNPSSSCVRCKKVRELSDAFGRPSATIVADGSGGSIESDTSYDVLGRVNSVSHPYQTNSTPQWETYSYDSKNRVVSITHPDNNSTQWRFGTTSGTTAPVSPLPDGLLHVQTQDEAQNETDYWYDVFGKIWQVQAAGGVTTYGYDALGNLTGVNQAGISGEVARTRSFLYDGLSRLITATNPESGTVCYGIWSGSSCTNGYDANGNLLAQTNANGFGSKYKYDALNRVTGKTYFNPSGTNNFWVKTYFYDGQSADGVAATTGGNQVGRLSSARSWAPYGNGWYDEYQNYDAMGRIAGRTEVAQSEAGHPVIPFLSATT